MQKSKKIGSVSATAKYGGHLEGFLAMPKGQNTFSTPTINHCRGLKEGLETLTSSALTNNHCRGLREGLETLTSSTPTNNYCHGLREGLEIQLVSMTSTSFVSGFDIPEDTSSSIEPAETGYALWRRHCRHSGIKNLTPTTRSLCKYI